MNKRKRLQTYLEACIAFIILPLLNGAAFFYVNVFTANQTYIGNQLHHPLYLFLWGSFNALYFLQMTWQCLHRYQVSSPLVYGLLLFFCICMLLSVLVPYQSDPYAPISIWHVRLSMIGSAGYAALFFGFLLLSLLHGYHELRPYLYAYIGFSFLALYSYALHGGVTSFTEITYSFGMGILLFCLVHRRNANSHNQ